MADPVSWKIVERGWRVLAADGTDLGTVHEVVGDANIDIFNGLHVSPGLLKGSRYVPSERVIDIVEGELRLDVAAADFGNLDAAAAAPPSADVRTDTTDLRSEDD